MTFKQYMDKAYSKKELYHSQQYPYTFNKELKYKGLDLVIRGELTFTFEYYMVPRSEIVSKLDIIDFHVNRIKYFIIYKSYKNKTGNTVHECFYDYVYDVGEEPKEINHLFNIGLHEEDADFLKQKISYDFVKEMLKSKDDTLSPIRDYVDREVEHRKDEIKSEWAYDHSPGDIRI